MATNKTDKVLNVPTLRFPGFSEEWQKMRFDELLKFYSTNSLSWEKLEYDRGDFYNLHYGLIHVGLPTLVDSSKYNLPTIKEDFLPRNYELVKDGDVAFADASEDTNEVAKAIEFINTDSNQIVCGLHTIHGRDKDNRTKIGFKGFYFSSPAFHNQVRRLAQGTKIYSVSTKILSECFVSLPSKDEQTKIANLLSLLDERIALQSKLIKDLKKLKSAIVDSVCSTTTSKIRMSDILTERTEFNENGYPICSVSVSMGVVNQIEYLGRSFAAKTTTHYNVVHYGDIVYTKSPTGDFPYGIIKRSAAENPVAVSPLYGVYVPNSDAIGIFLNEMFCNPIKAKNYLHPLIQKGAKNTIIISNQRFLENYVPLPEANALGNVAKVLMRLNEKLTIEISYLESINRQKSFLLSAMFI